MDTGHGHINTFSVSITSAPRMRSGSLTVTRLRALVCILSMSVLKTASRQSSRIRLLVSSGVYLLWLACCAKLQFSKLSCVCFPGLSVSVLGLLLGYVAMRKVALSYVQVTKVVEGVPINHMQLAQVNTLFRILLGAKSQNPTPPPHPLRYAGRHRACKCK